MFNSKSVSSHLERRRTKRLKKEFKTSILIPFTLEKNYHSQYGDKNS